MFYWRNGLSTLVFLTSKFRRREKFFGLLAIDNEFLFLWVKLKSFELRYPSIIHNWVIQLFLEDSWRIDSFPWMRSLMIIVILLLYFLPDFWHNKLIPHKAFSLLSWRLSVWWISMRRIRRKLKNISLHNFAF